MASRILCVAEKPSVAKAVAGHLSGGALDVRHTGNQYVKNYEFTFTFPPPWGSSRVVMTSVIGHIKTLDFDAEYRKWSSCNPKTLFDCPIVNSVDKDKVAIAKNIEAQARYARALFIWTDCDREGEHIGTEIRDVAWQANPRLPVKRARFSNVERSHILAASQRLVDVDERQANAVQARIELDLRIGAALTRLQTRSLQTLGPELTDMLLSYGSCQFPTLGFVVDRYFQVKNFVPEPFWRIDVRHVKDGVSVAFHWDRVHLFDRMAVTILFERCLTARKARITSVQKKPTSHWRPLPLTTIELQKNATRFLRMDSQRVMKHAEDLYTKGFISYPRTETDQFDKAMDLRKLVEKQTPDSRWGQYAGGLLSGSFKQPRAGTHNDKAHPPIHPVSYAAPSALDSDEKKRLYEFIVRRFLACCSDDAKGESTTILLAYGPEGSEETFHTSGLLVLQRNFLDVYPYDKWESSQQLPAFTVGEEFTPTEATMSEGRTSAPGYLTEPDLLALMDANGIGTDATMAEHIAKIKERNYVMTQGAQGGSHTETTRGRGRGGRGRGGRGGGGGGGGTGRARGEEFIPTTLGVALIMGYESVGFETSLSKPFLRKEMELRMKDICDGKRTRSDVVNQSLDEYREVFVRTQQQIDLLRRACRKYVLGEDITIRTE